jgi:hypothetical protein
MNNEWLSRRDFDCSIKDGILCTKLDCERNEEMLEEHLEMLEAEFKFSEELRD